MSTSNSPEWIRVTNDSPCRHCRKTDHQCKTSKCGRYEICYVLNSGDGREKRAKSDQTYFVYATGLDKPGRRRELAAPSRRSPSIALADADTLHSVYSAILGNPAANLTTGHRQALRDRGFPDQLIDYLGYRSHPGTGAWKIVRAVLEEFDEKVVLSIPGLYRRRGDDGQWRARLGGQAGLLIPVRDYQERIVGLISRPDDRSDPKRPKYFWLSSADEKKGNGPGPGAPAHVSIAAKGATDRIRLTEGQLKADLSGYLSKIRTIGCAGVDNFGRAVEAATKLGARVVQVAYDADSRRNLAVARALVKLAKALRSAGIEVEVEVWDEADGKGIDDVLAAGKPTAILAGEAADSVLAEAARLAGVEPPSPTPDAILARVESLVAAGSFAALITDDALMVELAKIEGSGTMALVRSKVKDARKAGFSLGELNNRIKAARDHFKAKDKEAREAARPNAVAREGDKTVVLISTDEHVVNDEALAALSRASNLYVRGSNLVKIARVPSSPREKVRRPDGTPRIVPLASQSLRELTTEIIDWRKEVASKDGEVVEKPTHPPQWSVDAIMSRGEWPMLRPIEGIAEAPVLRPDGTILDTPGWDQATGIFYQPACDFPAIPDRPSLEEAKRAVGIMWEIVRDFPFATIEYDGQSDGGQTHFSAWLAGLLTPLARYAIDGPVPLIRVDANTAASGKTKLCHIISIVVIGREMAVTSYPHDEAEQDKLLLSIALAGDPMTLFDNVANGGTLGGAPLDAVLTTTTKNGRRLGASEMTGDLPWNTVLYATGNNLSVAGDGLRRILPIRLETAEERPETRIDFAIQGDILDHVRTHRPELVAAALTILRGFIAAGRPRPKTPLTAMDYSAWSALVRHAVHWATGYDPAATREEMIATDSEANDRIALIEGLAELPNSDRGLTAAEILRLVCDVENKQRYDRLRDAMAEWSTTRDMPTPKVIGKRLKAIKGKVINRKIVSSTPYQGTQRWQVEPSELGGSEGSCGSATSYAGERDRKNKIPAHQDKSSFYPLAGDGGLPNSHDSTDSHETERGRL